MQNVNAYVVASYKLFEWKQILNKCDNYVSMKMLFFFYSENRIWCTEISQISRYIIVGNDKNAVKCSLHFTGT